MDYIPISGEEYNNNSNFYKIGKYLVKFNDFDIYFNNGILHREDGPSFIWHRRVNQLYQEDWYINNKLDRKDGGPSVIFKDGEDKIYKVEYHTKGKLNREGDLPAIDSEGYKCYYKNGVLDRDIRLGPSLTRDNKVENWVAGKRYPLNVRPEDIKDFDHNLMIFDWKKLSVNPNVCTLENLINYPDLPWDYTSISQNSNFTIEMLMEMDIFKSYREEPQFYSCLRLNPNLTLDDILKYNLKDKIQLTEIINIHYLEMEQHPELPWLYRFMGNNRTLTLDYLMQHPEFAETNEWMKNPSLVNWDVITEYPDPSKIIPSCVDGWVLDSILQNPSITWDIIQENPSFFRHNDDQLYYVCSLNPSIDIMVLYEESPTKHPYFCRRLPIEMCIDEIKNMDKNNGNLFNEIYYISENKNLTLENVFEISQNYNVDFKN